MMKHIHNGRIGIADGDYVMSPRKCPTVMSSRREVLFTMGWYGTSVMSLTNYYARIHGVSYNVSYSVYYTLYTVVVGTCACVWVGV